jgi:starch synthase
VTLRVLSVASEAFPLVKTGGLADVTGALPAALAAHDVAMRTLLPGYPAVSAALAGTEGADAAPVMAFADLFGGRARLLAGTAGGLDLLVLDAPHLFDRPGNPYLGPDGNDWPDNAQRFAALAWVGAEIAAGALEDYRPAGALAPYRPDILHGHDWQAGLAPAYLHFRPDTPAGRLPGRRAATVLTVHNLGFPGLAPAGLLDALRLPPAAFATEGVEYYGAIGMLKAGLHFADRITTVSPGYAAEIMTPEAGMGLDGVLRARAGAVSGILNGIDTTIWNPATDPVLAARFDAGRLAGRAANKAALQSAAGLAPDPAAPLFGVVSRLTGQKGMDVLLACLPTLLGLGGQLALLGAGDAALEAAFRAAAAAAPGRIACTIGYDEAQAHRMQAGIDALLVPSRFEPCGLTQLYAQRYGAVPVVSRVGGLADTVIDANPVALAAGVATGVQFAPVSVPALDAALRRAVSLYRDAPTWRAMQANGMAADVSWRGPAAAYAALYRAMVAA